MPDLRNMLNSEQAAKLMKDRASWTSYKTPRRPSACSRC